jgi:hypothetical protein
VISRSSKTLKNRPLKKHAFGESGKSQKTRLFEKSPLFWVQNVYLFRCCNEIWEKNSVRSWYRKSRCFWNRVPRNIFFYEKIDVLRVLIETASNLTILDTLSHDVWTSFQEVRFFSNISKTFIPAAKRRFQLLKTLHFFGPKVKSVNCKFENTVISRSSMQRGTYFFPKKKQNFFKT